MIKLVKKLNATKLHTHLAKFAFTNETKKRTASPQRQKTSTSMAHSDPRILTKVHPYRYRVLKSTDMITLLSKINMF